MAGMGLEQRLYDDGSLDQGDLVLGQAEAAADIIAGARIGHDHMAKPRRGEHSRQPVVGISVIEAETAARVQGEGEGNAQLFP